MKRNKGGTMKKDPSKRDYWMVATDDQGYAKSISYRGNYMLHLNPGTAFNERYAARFVKMLNAKGCRLKDMI